MSTPSPRRFHGSAQDVVAQIARQLYSGPRVKDTVEQAGVALLVLSLLDLSDMPRGQLRAVQVALRQLPVRVHATCLSICPSLHSVDVIGDRVRPGANTLNHRTLDELRETLDHGSSVLLLYRGAVTDAAPTTAAAGPPFEAELSAYPRHICTGPFVNVLGHDGFYVGWQGDAALIRLHNVEDALGYDITARYIFPDLRFRPHPSILPYVAPSVRGGGGGGGGQPSGYMTTSLANTGTALSGAVAAAEEAQATPVRMMTVQGYAAWHAQLMAAGGPPLWGDDVAAQMPAPPVVNNLDYQPPPVRRNDPWRSSQETEMINRGDLTAAELADLPDDAHAIGRAIADLAQNRGICDAQINHMWLRVISEIYHGAGWLD